MRILLDTHIFLWYVQDNPKLIIKFRSVIENAMEVYVSSASIWEAAIKTQIGKLDVNIEDLVRAIVSSGFQQLPITAEHAAATSRLTDFHRDPFDRLLIAQAMIEPLCFLTVDEKLKKYSSLVSML
jgi:PIN domain nuclease of toxin-antitoxin system